MTEPERRAVEELRRQMLDRRVAFNRYGDAASVVDDHHLLLDCVKLAGFELRGAA